MQFLLVALSRGFTHGLLSIFLNSIGLLRANKGGYGSKKRVYGYPKQPIFVKKN